jgi:hypothetical protein
MKSHCIRASALPEKFKGDEAEMATVCTFPARATFALESLFSSDESFAPESVQSVRTRRFSDVSHLPHSFSTFFFTELLKTGVN